MSQPGQLVKKIRIKGKIKALTGLHIGGSNIGLNIGGIDNTVIRDSFSGQPYIPGSSLKGKMRTLLEKANGLFQRGNMGRDIKNVPYTQPNPNNVDGICVVKIFGTTPEDWEKAMKTEEPVTRLIVRDCKLSKQSAAKIGKLKSTDMPFTELKTEVVIDRITSAAMPRQYERVPAGAVFNMELILNVFHDENEQDFLKKIFESLLLLQNDYLGGKGTRGSGAVSISIRSVEEKTMAEYAKAEAGKWSPTASNLIPSDLQNDRTQK